MRPLNARAPENSEDDGVDCPCVYLKTFAYSVGGLIPGVVGEALGAAPLPGLPPLLVLLAPFVGGAAVGGALELL